MMGNMHTRQRIEPKFLTACWSITLVVQPMVFTGCLSAWPEAENCLRAHST